MEIASSFSSSLPSQPFFVAVLFTVLCLMLALFFARSLPLFSKPKLAELEGGAESSANESENKNKEKRCCCSCHCNGSVGIVGPSTGPNTTTYLNGGGSTKMVGRSPVIIDKHTGASMMEQLVPEITTHALSYLDFPSLCRLSMTNSLMRKAANDDNAWKALYHKDFTLEQDSITPINGWKAYYAATRAIVNTNTEFFNIISESSLSSMSRFWLNADYVKCFHASGEYSTGFRNVIQSWQRIFNWEQSVNFHVRDVKARILTDLAWVTMKAYVDVDTGPFNMSNLFEFIDGRWYMVGHHCSDMEPEVEQPIVHG